ncbi:MAG: BlaI/MecI/CopY family transcriptional regulator [Planctomycetota bacterium]|nr:MAG: BlaI/MecI/CopY family transcriptional regulator [Planctomycetota bacterium]
MGPPPKLVSDTELQILKVLWQLGEGTVRDVLREAEVQGRDWAYTTAQTLLNRLQDKGFVASEKRGRAFLFRAAVSRDDLLGRSLKQLAERVCDGASLPLLLNLVHGAGFSSKEREAFRELLDRLDREELN